MIYFYLSGRILQFATQLTYKIMPLIYKTIENEIHILSTITKTTIDRVTSMMSDIIDNFYKENNLDTAIIMTYVVESLGGELLPVITFFEFVTQIKRQYPAIQFVSIITGSVVGSALLLCLYADVRIITKNATVCIIESSYAMSGSFDQLIEQHNQTTILQNTIKDFLLQTIDQITIDLIFNTQDNTLWLNSDDCLKHNLIDIVLC